MTEPEPCGCRALGWWEPPSGESGVQSRIHYCSIHAAAPKLLAALKAIAEHRHNTEEAQRLAGYRNPGAVLRDEAFFARAVLAIAEATGGETELDRELAASDVEDGHADD